MKPLSLTFFQPDVCEFLFFLFGSEMSEPQLLVEAAIWAVLMTRTRIFAADYHEQPQRAECA